MTVLHTSQFLMSNQNQIMDVFNHYRDLVHDFPHFVMYMDKDSWELFDPNAGKTIFKCGYRHLKFLKENLIKFRRDLINCGVMVDLAAWRIHRDKPRCSQSERWSYKALRKIYTDIELMNLYNRKTNETIAVLHEAENLADNN